MKNRQYLSSVDFGSRLLQKNGFEHIFRTTSDLGIGDPPTSSLLNVQTMKRLCQIGPTVPNVMKDDKAILGDTFRLDNEWFDLAKTLELPDENYVYMIWLWMETAWDHSLIR